MERVPSPKVGTSKTPSGPFQRTVWASARAASKATRVSGPTSTADHELGIFLTGTTLCSAPRVTSLATTTSLGRSRSTPRSAGAGHDALGVLDAVALEQALADAVVLRRQERVGHAAADDELVDPVEQRLQDLDLVRDLGPADDRGEGPGRVLEQAREVADLALHEQPGVGRQELRHAHRRGMRAVGRAEGIVDVDVAVARRGRPRTRGRWPPPPGGSAGSRGGASGPA